MIVLISGKMGSGKDTIGEALEYEVSRRRSWYASQFKFAGLIYQMHDYCRDLLKDCNIDIKHHVKDGNLLQLLGTEWGRNTLGENVWCDALKAKIKSNSSYHMSDNWVYIITDCRFRNEFDAFPEALRVRLECDRDIRKSRVSMWRENEMHPSETDLDKYAADGKFDLVLDTKEMSPGRCVELIVAELIKGDWTERRKTKC